MTGADAVYARFADVFVASGQWPGLREALTQAPSKRRAKCVR